jgi:hypothetical protein
MAVSNACAQGGVVPRPSLPPPLRAVGRFFLGSLSLFAGVVHLALAGSHFEEVTWLGVAFLGDGLGLTILGVWLLLANSPGTRRAAGFLAAVTALAYLGSRTIGLPGMHREGWDGLGVVTTISELLIFASMFLSATRHHSESSVTRTKGGMPDVR